MKWRVKCSNIKGSDIRMTNIDGQFWSNYFFLLKNLKLENSISLYFLCVPSVSTIGSVFVHSYKGYNNNPLNCIIQPESVKGIKSLYKSLIPSRREEIKALINIPINFLGFQIFSATKYSNWILNYFCPHLQKLDSQYNNVF